MRSGSESSHSLTPRRYHACAPLPPVPARPLRHGCAPPSQPPTAADAPTVVKPPSAMEVLGGRARSLPAVPDVVPLPKTLDELCSFSVMPRDHTNYAATWLTLSAATAALAVKAVRGTMRRA